VSWISRLLRGPFAETLEQAGAQPSAPLALPAQFTVDGEEVTLRFLRPTDGDAILAFARKLPDHDLLFLRRDITRRDQVDAWLREMATGQLVSIVAVCAEELVGYATVASDGLTWRRHVRELRVMVAERMRGKRLGQVLTAQAFAVAREQGVRKMVAQMTTDQKGAIAVFQRLGFEQEACLRGQVIDRAGREQDLQIMTLDVDAFESKLDAALWVPTLEP